MSGLDWLIVILLNGSIIAYGLVLSRGVESSSDWFLAGRRLPWWLVGISMYATAIDSSDLVADSGGTYTMGLSYFVNAWIGVVGGWAIAGFVVFPVIYRAGMYTNAEYLEARFGPSVRVLCALIQVQYRTMVLAIIATTLYLVLSIVCGWGSGAWWAVAVIAALATVYTALGGLRTVAITDSLQFIVMTMAGLIIWGIVWNSAGGWDGVTQKLTDQSPELASQLLHAGADNIQQHDVSQLTADAVQRRLLLGGRYDADSATITQRTPAWVVAVALIIVGFAYSIVNHTQAMRMFAARSEWDMKMSVFVAGAIMLPMAFFNLSMGVMGRALHPDPSILPLERTDSIYPYLVTQLATSGIRGIVVAGVLAASFSTFDSIGSTLSALLTRDVYARLFVRDRDDRHYMRVGQWLTPVIIGGSFVYVPFMEDGMLLFFIDLTSTFVIPLLTLFLMGILTPVNHRSGLIGLIVGSGYGMLRLLAGPVAERYGMAILPAMMVNSFAAYLFSMLLTAAAMVVVSLILGWEPNRNVELIERSGWLRSSQLAIQEIAAEQSEHTDRLPVVLAALIVLAGCVLSFLIFW